MIKKKIYVILIFNVLFSFAKCSICEEYNPEYFGYKKYIKGLSTGAEVIPWNTDEGIKMFNESIKSGNAKPFFALAHHFAGQQTNSTCGPSSARIILEAIYERQERKFPLDYENSFYKEKNGVDSGRFAITERNIFSVYKKGKDESKDYDIISRRKMSEKHGKYCGGMDIEKLAEVIAMHKRISVKTKIVKLKHMKQSSIDKFRKTVEEVTSNEGQYMIVNYYLKIMYDKDSGHFSPLVAYNKSKDMVLIMDVATHLGVWTWVKLEELYRDMESSLCPPEKCNRGYIIIKERN